MFNFFTYANHGMLHADNFVSKVFFVVTHHWMYSNLVPTSHGNNLCDGLGATVKNTCYRPAISNRKVIGNADDVYKFCRDNL
jgi:hypothetical protein